MDVGGVRVGEPNEGREKGPVQGEHRGVGTFPAQKGVGEGRRRFDVEIEGVGIEGGRGVATMRSKADGTSEGGEEERTSRRARIPEADPAKTSRESREVKGGRGESRVVGEVGKDEGDGGGDGRDERGLVGEDG